MKTIDLIAGARPNFVKMAPIIDALEDARAKGGGLQYRLIHTGQHYDHAMSGEFFSQLGIPDPDIHLESGSGSQAEQTATIMCRYEQVLADSKSDLCLVVGDVTSTMACSIVARKMGVPVAHVEAGIRSNDWSMPEEINRVVTDAVTNWFFTTSRVANDNLVKSGIPESRIFFVGNVMIDTLQKQRQHFRAPPVWNELQLNKKGYFVLTMHRPANVDGAQKLSEFLSAISQGAQGLPVIFPAHPRTKKMLDAIQGDFRNIKFVAPLGYLEFNYLVENSKGVITDSGGITEEATVLGIPCMTLRDNTERPETVSEGTNELVGTCPSQIAPAMQRVCEGKWKKGGIPELWDGHAAERIVALLAELLFEPGNGSA